MVIKKIKIGIVEELSLLERKQGASGAILTMAKSVECYARLNLTSPNLSPPLAPLLHAEFVLSGCPLTQARSDRRRSG